MNKLTILLLLLIFPAVLFAQQDSIMQFTLQQAQDYALEYNIDIKNANLDVDIANKVVWETTTIGLPQINASGSYNNNLSLATQLIPGEFFGQEPGTFMEIQFGTKHNFNGSLNVSQLIFNGTYFVGLQAAKIYRNLSTQGLEKVEIDTKADIAGTYYSILLTEKNLEIMRSNVEDLSSSHKEMTAMHKAGVMDITEVDKIKITMVSLENAAKTIERQIDFLYLLLKIQLGLNNNQQIELSESLDDIFGYIDYGTILDKKFNIADNIEFKLISTQEQLMELDMKKEKSAYYPVISAFYNYQQNAMRNEFNPLSSDEKWFASSMVGLSIEIPIFSSGMRRSKVQQARLELEKTSNSKEFLTSTLESLLLQARNNLINARETLESNKTNRDLSKRVYSNMQIKQKNGVASSLELTQANKDYLTTVSDYTQSMIDLLNAKIALEKILNEL